MGKTLGNHSTWLHEEDPGELFTAPSMVEPVRNLSIEEILADYTRGIVHSSRPALYDEGEDVEEVDVLDDFSDVLDPAPAPAARPAPQVSEPSQAPGSEPVQEDLNPSE